jgi:rod shape-determining protein MreB
VVLGTIVVCHVVPGTTGVFHVVPRRRCVRSCRQTMHFDVKSAFSDDVAIDLGTTNTLVHVAGRGIILDEPSIVAVRTCRGERQIIAVGRKATALVERAPENLQIERPLREGVIADFIATEVMLRQFIKRTKSLLGFGKPRILISVPAGATPVERRAVYDTARSLGARKVYLIAEPVAASLGAALPVPAPGGAVTVEAPGGAMVVEAPGGAMVVDIGGGTTDIAVMLGGIIVSARTLRCAGNAMDEAIIRYVRRKHQLLIGEASAERIKIEAGTALAALNGRAVEVHIRGRDLRKGLAKSVLLTPKDVAEALSGPIETIADFVQRALEELPPDVLSDITQRGIHLTGGGALLDKIDVALTRQVGVKCHVQRNAMHCVIKGAAAVLADLDEHTHLLMQP